MEKEFIVSQRERNLIIETYDKWGELSMFNRPKFKDWVRSITKSFIFIPPITAEEYHQATGKEAEQDDLERCNCPEIGTVGHQSCGWNEAKQLPNWMCTR